MNDNIQFILIVLFSIFVMAMLDGGHTPDAPIPCQVKECAPECDHSIQKDPATDKQ